MNRDVCEHFAPISQHGENCNPSLCLKCKNLEVWPRLFGGLRFVCFETNKVRVNNSVKNAPKVRRCEKFNIGRHYSVKNLLGGPDEH